jgi:hypothetical protein
MIEINDDDPVQREHEEQIKHGLPYDLKDCENVIWRSNNDKILVVTNDSKKSHRIFSEKLSCLAGRDIASFGGMSPADEQADERKIHLFNYIRDNRGIGLLIFELRTKIYQCSGYPPSTDNCNEIKDHSPLWSVGTIWVNKQYRGLQNETHIATELLAQSAKYLKVNLTEIGWYKSFTCDGERFARRINPETYFITI